MSGITKEKVHCNYCGKDGELETVTVPNHQYDDSETLCINTNGWFIGIAIDTGYEHGDEKIEIEKEDNFCSWTCIDSRRVQRETQRKERQEFEREKARINGILNKHVREHGMKSLRAMFGDDIAAAVREGKLK